MATGAERAHALIAHTADLFDAWDAADSGRSLPALEAAFEALDDFRSAEPVGDGESDHELWTRALTLADGLDALHARGTQEPFSADGFRDSQLALYAALLQAQGRFDEP